MKTNDIKSGTRIKLSNGWFGTMRDNKQGAIRLAEVEGIYTEIGSIYSHNIEMVRTGAVWANVELTPAQIKLRLMLG